MNPRIIKEGNYSPSNHNASSIVNGEGIAPTVMENHGTVTAIKIPAETICLNSKVNGKQPSVQDRNYDPEGIATACTTSFHPSIAIPQATKQGYIEVEQGGVFDAAYPESTTRRGRVQEGGKVTPTICTSNELSLYEGVKQLNKGDNEQIDKANTREVLCLLRKEIGEEAHKQTIGRLIGVFKKEILRCGMYEEGVCKTREQSGLHPSASFGKKDSLSNTGQCGEMRDMRERKQCGYTPQGWELSEQFNREFNDVMSQLPHEAASARECLLYLRRTCKGEKSMQQTLLTMEEVWRSPSQAMEYIQPQHFRIRKLSSRECFRLMGVSEENIDKIQAAGISNAQQYKMAGNSIVVDVLYHIFRKMFVDKEESNAELTLF
jgi:DNA (cytosine-5)-methyltransferase 1